MPGVYQTPLNPALLSPDLGRLGNSLLWKLGALATRGIQSQASALLRSLGTTRPDLKVSQSSSPWLNFVPVSPSLANIPADLPQKFAVTGYWFHSEPAYSAPSDLDAFLKHDAPPVVVSFGSMGGDNGAETADLLVEASYQCGRRVVIQKGFGNVHTTRDVDPTQVKFVDFVPHDLLFPQAACVVHHGGAGTTAAATRAGKPSVIIPHLADQLYWAKCLKQRGVASMSLSRRKLTASGLADMIRVTVEDPNLSENAQRLGQRIRAEDGTGAAVGAIEALDWETIPT